MPFQNYKNANNAQGQLLAGISASATSLILQAGQGALFPSTFPFFIKLEQLDTQANNYRVLKREIAKVTNRVADTFTIVRSSGTCPPDYQTLTPGTTAFSFNSSDVVTQVFIAEQIKDIQDNLATAAQISQIQNQSAIYGSDTGSINAYAITLSPAPTAYQAGQCFAFKAANTNTGSATININNLGAKTLYKLGGSTTLGAGDILSGQIVNIEYDGTNFQVTSPLGSTPTVDINGLAVITTAADPDAFIEYNAAATSNRKITFANLRRSIGRFGGIGTDGAVPGNASLTISGSNNTVITKNYTSWDPGDGLNRVYTNDPAAGSSIVLNMADTSIFTVGQKVRVSSSAGTEVATVTVIATNVSITVDTLALNHTTTSPLITRMNTLAITPTNCIVHIKVQGYCNLTNWYIDLQGKGGQSGPSYGYPLAIVQPGGGGGGSLNVVAGGAGGIASPKLHPNTPSSFINNKFLCVSPGSAGGTGGGGFSGGSSAGGTGGGCVIFEIFGDLTIDSVNTVINAKATAGANAASGGIGGGGGGAGGIVIFAYTGNLTGSNAGLVAGGTGGTGSNGGATGSGAWTGGGGGGGGNVYADGSPGGGGIPNNANGSVNYGGAGGTGASGFVIFVKNTDIA